MAMPILSGSRLSSKTPLASWGKSRGSAASFSSNRIPADDDGDQPGDFGGCPGEQGLDRREARVERRAALRERLSGKESERGAEDEGMADLAQPSS
jgi:hypothetical protein